MADETKDSLKSAYDLAMERLSRQGGPNRPLTEEQKKNIAEIESKARAKTAELEIMLPARLAPAGEDEEKIEKIKNAHQAEIAKIREKAAAEKEKIRNG